MAGSCRRIPLALTVFFAAGQAAETITVTPAEDERAVGSSTMLTLPGERFPRVDDVAVMFTWHEVEKQEGTYDFSAVDRAYDCRRGLGKRIQLRMNG